MVPHRGGFTCWLDVVTRPMSASRRATGEELDEASRVVHLDGRGQLAQKAIGGAQLPLGRVSACKTSNGILQHCAEMSKAQAESRSIRAGSIGTWPFCLTLHAGQPCCGVEAGGLLLLREGQKCRSNTHVAVRRRGREFLCQ